MNPMVHCQLWMGNLEPNMTESFIMAAFQKMGEHPQNVKVMRNKYTGEPAGYCFVHFGTDEAAIDAMHKLNGKPIPGTNPVVRFRLNNASRESKAAAPSEREFSLWVGDLSTDVDDYSLYRVFSQKYSSIKTAKVILDSSGFSKGYGFVRFGSEEEQKHALWAMNGYGGLGSKLLKICNAVPKPKSASNGTSSSQQFVTVPTDYSQQQPQQYYDPSAYWQNYSAAWSGYYGGSGEETAGTTPSWNTPAPDTSHPPPPAADHNLALVDHKMPLDTEQLNRETMEKERTLWDAMEASRWLSADIMEIY